MQYLVNENKEKTVSLSQLASGDTFRMPGYNVIYMKCIDLHGSIGIIKLSNGECVDNNLKNSTKLIQVKPDKIPNFVDV